MELNDILCRKCNRILAKPKFKETPPCYRNLLFELHGDKRKIYEKTENAIWEDLIINGERGKGFLIKLKCKHCNIAIGDLE